MKTQGKRLYQWLPALNFMILMAALGASDSLRGIFAPAFQNHFQLSSVGVSNIIVASYAGNLIFLSLGGRILDQYDRRKAMIGILALWLGALLLYQFTDSYLFLLTGMFLAMGTSTLLNTAVNIVTPMIFAASPGMMVNIFFFVQGIGTSASQNLAGNYAESYSSFRLVNLILAIAGVLSLVLMIFLRFPGEETTCVRQHHREGDTEDTARTKKKNNSQPVSYSQVIRHKSFLILVLLFGLYFIGEHGIMNWLVSYGSNALEMSTGTAAFYLSGFFGGITVGRLLLAPVVSKIGAFRSILLFGGVGTVLFVAGLLMGRQGLWLMSLSGLALSILYPTMVYMIRYIYPSQMLATAVGLIISIATVFDIGFNALFGVMVDVSGYRLSFLTIPLSMAGFYAVYILFWRHTGKALNENQEQGE